MSSTKPVEPLVAVGWAYGPAFNTANPWAALGPTRNKLIKCTVQCLLWGPWLSSRNKELSIPSSSPSSSQWCSYPINGFTGSDHFFNDCSRKGATTLDGMAENADPVQMMIARKHSLHLFIVWFFSFSLFVHFRMPCFFQVKSNI